MSFNKLKDFQEAAKKAEEEFLAAQAGDGNTPEPKPEPDPKPEPEPSPDPAPEPEPDDVHKKLKDMLKGMNEAQRKAAEAEKAKSETEKRLAELEKQYTEILDKAKKEKESAKAKPADDDPDLDSLFEELPDVAKIARAAAKRERETLAPEIAELRQMLQEERDARAKSEKASSGRQIYDDIVKVHPDYDSLVNSDEMTYWINNEAPPIFKAIFEGSVPVTAKDAITVLNAFKQTTTPTPKAGKDKPSPAEVAAPVKTNTPIVPRSRADDEMSPAEIESAMKNIHRMSPEEVAELNRRIETMFNP